MNHITTEEGFLSGETNKEKEKQILEHKAIQSDIKSVLIRNCFSLSKTINFNNDIRDGDMERERENTIDD